MIFDAPAVAQRAMADKRLNDQMTQQYGGKAWTYRVKRTCFLRRSRSREAGQNTRAHRSTHLADRTSLAACIHHIENLIPVLADLDRSHSFNFLQLREIRWH